MGRENLNPCDQTIQVAAAEAIVKQPLRPAAAHHDAMLDGRRSRRSGRWLRKVPPYRHGEVASHLRVATFTAVDAVRAFSRSVGPDFWVS